MSTSSREAADLNSNLYNLYIQDIQSLAQTIVIKIDQLGQALNVWVAQKTGVVPDPDDRTTWKYYQNISGLAHSSDTPMVVESLDTQTPITFSKAVLVSHPTTLAAYAFGSYYYNELVAKYPDQEMLILGILYPADMTRAIAAQDGTILSYPPELVDSNETDFIANLQSWIIDYMRRWIVKPFALSDNLYIATYVAQLTLHLVGAIMNLRLRACKTNQAHSFHIGQYLRSHGLLDFYISELTPEQTFDLYRNINYYVRKAGFESTFQQLVELLMTKRNLPLYQYVFKQKASAIQYVDVQDTTNLYAPAAFKRLPLNAPAVAQPLTEFNLTDVFALSDPKAPGNEAFQAAHQADVETVFDLATNASLGTKIIESTLGVTSAYHAQAPEAIIFNHWFSLAAQGVYTAGIQFTPPGTTIPIQLTQPQAVALWIYALGQALKPLNPPSDYHEITQVPQVAMRFIARKVLPSFSTLRGLSVAANVSDALINQVLSLAAPVPDTITSVASFIAFTSSVYEAVQNQFLTYSFQEDPRTRGQLEYLCETMYSFTVGALPGMFTSLSPYTGKDYIDVLSDMGFTPSNYSQLDFYNLTIQLYEAATGATLNALSNPVNVQAAMIELLTLLSSYSIQVVSTTNQADVTNVGRPEIRAYNFNLEEQPLHIVDTAAIIPDWSLNAETNNLVLDWDSFFPYRDPMFVEEPYFDFRLDTGLLNEATLEPTFPALIPTTTTVTSTFDPDVGWAALSPAQQQALLLLPPAVALS